MRILSGALFALALGIAVSARDRSVAATRTEILDVGRFNFTGGGAADSRLIAEELSGFSRMRGDRYVAVGDDHATLYFLRISIDSENRTRAFGFVRPTPAAPGPGWTTDRRAEPERRSRGRRLRRRARDRVDRRRKGRGRSFAPLPGRGGSVERARNRAPDGGRRGAAVGLPYDPSQLRLRGGGADGGLRGDVDGQRGSVDDRRPARVSLPRARSSASRRSTTRDSRSNR